MAITKLSNIGTPQGGGAAHLKNCISYILNSDKTEGLVGGNAGTTPQEVYQAFEPEANLLPNTHCQGHPQGSYPLKRRER